MDVGMGGIARMGKPDGTFSQGGMGYGSYDYEPDERKGLAVGMPDGYMGKGTSDGGSAEFEMVSRTDEEAAIELEQVEEVA